MGVSLLVITDGRMHELQECIKSLAINVNYDFDYKIIVNDSQDAEFTSFLMNDIDHFTVLHNRPKGGLSGSIRTGWDFLKDKTDYIFHVEEDFTFPKVINIQDLCFKLEESQAVQMLLKRDPVLANPQEAAFGGYIESDPDAFTQHNGYMTHRKFFSLNPGIYSTNICKIGWPDGGGEYEFYEHLKQYTNSPCAIYGSKFDAPLVNHIGFTRSKDWKL